MEANWLAITLSIGGPGAAWIAAFVVICFVMPEDRLVPRRQDEVRYYLKESDKRGGWLAYEEWTKKIVHRDAVIRDKNDLYFITQMLPCVYYQESEYRLNHPTIETLFVYAGERALKFQRIHGERVGNNRPSIYVGGAASTAEGTANCYLFLMDKDNRVYDARSSLHGQWEEILDATAECLVVTIYEEEKTAPDSLSTGDYLCVDVSKYADERSSESGLCDVALIVYAHRPFTDFQLWEYKATVLPETRVVPLKFRFLNSDATRSADSGSDTPDLRSDGLRGWFSALNEELLSGTLPEETPREDAFRFLREVSEILAGRKLEEGETFNLEASLKEAKLPARERRDVEQIKNVVLATLLAPRSGASAAGD
jgi:hypothetical protein